MQLAARARFDSRTQRTMRARVMGVASIRGHAHQPESIGAAQCEAPVLPYVAAAATEAEICRSAPPPRRSTIDQWAPHDAMTAHVSGERGAPHLCVPMCGARPVSGPQPNCVSPRAHGSPGLTPGLASPQSTALPQPRPTASPASPAPSPAPSPASPQTSPAPPPEVHVCTKRQTRAAQRSSVRSYACCSS